MGDGLSDDPTVGDRARALREELRLSQVEMAKALGMSVRGWQKIERDEGLPNGETLMLFKTIGINPGWVLTGLGPKSADARPEPTNDDLIVFIQVLPDIGKAIERAYKASNARINEFDLVHGAAKWLGEIQKLVKNDIGDRELLLSLIPWVETQVKREIAEANAGERKRSGSG